jgi:hypothetical protein
MEQSMISPRQLSVRSDSVLPIQIIPPYLDIMNIFKPSGEMISRYPTLAVLGLVLVVFGATLLNKSRGPLGKLPPGPRGIPILGNVPQLIGQKWLTFTALKEKYGASVNTTVVKLDADLTTGPIVYLNAAGQHIVVLNTITAAAEVLDRKAVITSNRPRSIVVGIMTGELLIAFLNTTDV